MRGLETLDPERWPEAIEQLQQALATYGSDPPTWQKARIALFLFWLGGSDESAVSPIAERLDSPVFSAMFAFFRGVPYYMVGDDATAAELAGQAVTLARAVRRRSNWGRRCCWGRRVASAAARRHGRRCVRPTSRIARAVGSSPYPLGIVAVAEETAQALAIRGHHEEAFVLWGAVDNRGSRQPTRLAATVAPIRTSPSSPGPSHLHGGPGAPG